MALTPRQITLASSIGDAKMVRIPMIQTIAARLTGVGA